MLRRRCPAPRFQPRVMTGAVVFLVFCALTGLQPARVLNRGIETEIRKS